MANKLLSAVVLFALIIISTSCAVNSPPTATVTLTGMELRYKILDAFPNFFWCDPDYFPVGRPSGEESNAAAQFDAIRNNAEEFAAILKRISLDQKQTYTAEEQLLVYRQHKLLTRVLVDFQPSNDGFTFVIRIGDGQGERIEGNIATTGTIKVTKRETSFNSCPICLSKGTLIDTPIGMVAVENLTTGMKVWTLDDAGQKVAAQIIQTAMTPEPTSFELLKITLSDGRMVTASPRHPAADGRLLGNLRIGDQLDGAIVKSIATVAYEGRTFDILPAGPTGLYWANGILLASTIIQQDCGC